MIAKITELGERISEFNDEKAFEELVHLSFPGLLSFANSLIKDKQESEEIVEDVFVKFWENRKMLPTIRNIQNYLYIATKHAALNHLRSKSYTQRKKQELVSVFREDFAISVRSSEERIISEENLNVIREAINFLSPKCRLIFRLIKEEGLKYNEVADLLEISPKTVNNQMILAMRKIGDILPKMFPEHFLKRKNNSF